MSKFEQDVHSGETGEHDESVSDVSMPALQEQDESEKDSLTEKPVSNFWSKRRERKLRRMANTLASPSSKETERKRRFSGVEIIKPRRRSSGVGYKSLKFEDVDEKEGKEKPVLAPESVSNVCNDSGEYTIGDFL